MKFASVEEEKGHASCMKCTQFRK